jgi:hypothetical protein
MCLLETDAGVGVLRFMCKLISILVIFSTFAVSQETTSPLNQTLPVPRLEKGIVEGKTYKNASIGLELTPDPKLRLGTPELNGKAGNAKSSIEVMALGKFISGSAREATAFWAVGLTLYPVAKRSTDAVMQKVVEANQNNGLKPLQGSSEGELGGATFLRRDFVLQEHRGYEAVFVRACNKLALGFVFTGSDRDAVNKLIAATELKLDLRTADCAAQSHAE